MRVHVLLALLVVCRSGYGEVELDSNHGQYETLLEWIRDLGGAGLVKEKVVIKEVAGMGMGLVAATDLPV